MEVLPRHLHGWIEENQEEPPSGVREPLVWRKRYIFGWFLARIPAGIPATLTEGFPGFLQYLEESSGIALLLRESQ
jgi:hypothetical protein